MARMKSVPLAFVGLCRICIRPRLRCSGKPFTWIDISLCVSCSVEKNYAITQMFVLGNAFKPLRWGRCAALSCPNLVRRAMWSLGRCPGLADLWGEICRQISPPPSIMLWVDSPCCAFVLLGAGPIRLTQTNAHSRSTSFRLPNL